MNPENPDRMIILIGAGGHAKSVIGVIQVENRWLLAGLLEERSTTTSRSPLGYPVLGGMEQFTGLRAGGITRGLAAIGDNAGRSRAAAAMVAEGFELVKVIHPSACLMSDCQIGLGTFVHALSVIGPECQVGRNAIIQPYVSLGHETKIGDHVQFCPGVHVGGKVTIGDFCFFGPGAVVYPRVRIGHNVSVGANSVINKDIPDHATVAGNPARVVQQS